MKKNRLFGNKIWQATRYLFLLLDGAPLSETTRNLTLHRQPADLPLIHQWIYSRLHSMVQRINSGFIHYDFHHATEALYRFLYAELCDVFLEAVKPLEGSEQEISALVLANCLDVSLRCMAPFMPYLSEELYQRLHSQLAIRHVPFRRSCSILIAAYPKQDEVFVSRSLITDVIYVRVYHVASFFL